MTYTTPTSSSSIGSTRLVHIIDETKRNRTHCNRRYAAKWVSATADDFKNRCCTNCRERYAYKKNEGLI